MRENKFRAWDKKHNRWVVCNMHIDGSGLLFYQFGDECRMVDNPEDWEIVWYTGLKDKNGKEIYEGDILSHGGDNHNGVVVWDDDFGVPGFHVKESALKEEKGFKRTHGLPPSTAPMEVIGNIYENPKLKSRWGRS